MPNSNAVSQADHTTATHGPLVLERYRLQRRLGSGGMGTVWLAHDEHLDRMVAVKRIVLGDEGVAKRAEREAKAAARLSHPGIVALFEAGRDDDAVYLVSELVRGRTLGQLFADGALSDREICLIGAALCDALVHAHQRGVVHRDVKPANVIVPEAPEKGAGIAKLTDFGIARLHGEDVLTRTGDIVGTLAYMAPEQADGKEAKEPADLYALALVIYEGLAGVNPVRGRTPASTVRRVGVRLTPLERLRRDLPVELCRAIDRAVAPRPDERGKLKDLRAALRAGAGEVDDEPGTVEGGALEVVTRLAGRRHVRLDQVGSCENGRVSNLDEASGEPWTVEEGMRAPASPSGRALAALTAGALATAALAWLGPQPPLAPLAGGVIAAAVVAALPRVGFAALALALIAWLLVTPEGTIAGAGGGLVGAAGAPAADTGGGGVAQGNGGLALLVLVAALPTVALLWRAPGTWWPAPAVAPALGLLGLAAMFPVLAGQARRLGTRALLGALGLWWLLLAEALTGRTLLLGSAPDAGARATWSASAGEASEHALWPALSGGALAIAALWALAAALLPLVVRGRAAALDLITAAMWAAGLAAATEAVAQSLGWAPQPRGLVAGAILGGAAAVAARAWRGPT